MKKIAITVATLVMLMISCKKEEDPITVRYSIIPMVDSNMSFVSYSYGNVKCRVDSFHLYYGGTKIKPDYTQWKQSTIIVDNDGNYFINIHVNSQKKPQVQVVSYRVRKNKILEFVSDSLFTLKRVDSILHLDNGTIDLYQ